MDGDWMAVEALYQGPAGRAPTATRSCLWWSTSPTHRRTTRAGKVWNAGVATVPDRGCAAELTLFLALIHHIVIGGNIPLGDFLGWLASLGTAVVIEFVDRNDEMVETLLRNKEDCYTDYSLENFERHLGQHYTIQKKHSLKNGKRQIYFALPRQMARAPR